MLIHCVINRESNLNCKNIMGFGDINTYMLRTHRDVLQEVWEAGQSLELLYQ